MGNVHFMDNPLALYSTCEIKNFIKCCKKSMVGELSSVQDSFVRGDLLQKSQQFTVLFEYYMYGNVRVCCRGMQEVM